MQQNQTFLGFQEIIYRHCSTAVAVGVPLERQLSFPIRKVVTERKKYPHSPTQHPLRLPRKANGRSVRRKQLMANQNRAWRGLTFSVVGSFTEPLTAGLVRDWTVVRRSGSAAWGGSGIKRSRALSETFRLGPQVFNQTVAPGRAGARDATCNPLAGRESWSCRSFYSLIA